MTPDEQALCAHPVFRYFYQICRIPHGSGNEKALSDFLLSWARGLGLEAEQDGTNNVLVRRNASPGYEAAPAVMLQAHIDMVCEKAEGVDHDFAKDPISWVINGDELSTGGRTTLGADDGIGAALAMALLEDGGFPHPALEALFTTGEEDDFSGASGFDMGKSRAAFLINLDNTLENAVLCGSCGGTRADLRFPLETAAVPDGWRAFRLSVSGLRGGHSGEDIHRGRGNANQLLTRALLAAEDLGPFLLHSIRGGSFRLAIPREAEAVLWLDPAGLPALEKKLAALEADFRAELAVTANRVRVELAPARAERTGLAPEKALSALALVPDGIFQMSEALECLVDASDNLGEVYLDGSQLHLVLELRAAKDSVRDDLFRRMECLAGLLGGSCTGSCAYPGWEFRPDSKLRELYNAAYRAENGRDLTVLTVHAGLEPGCFFRMKPELDAISVGPNCRDFHSPAETLEIGSTKRVYGYLKEALASVR